MMTTQFTPGPWTVRSEESPLDFGMELSMMAGEKTICAFYDTSPEDYENARLIAAARELLNLLIESRVSIGGDWRQRRDLAIKKATGAAS